MKNQDDMNILIPNGHSHETRSPIKGFSQLIHLGMKEVSWKLLIGTCTFLYSCYTIFMHLCEVDGRLPFSTGSVVLLTELFKLMASAIFFVPEAVSGVAKFPRSRMMYIWFGIPAFLYAFNNNLAMYIQLEMDPATYQVLGNFKILTTAILYRVIIQKEITSRKWIALAFLMVAGISNSYAGLQTADHSASVLHISVRGLVMLLCYCSISGLSGVVTEWILKKEPDLSLHLQNGMLYVYGVVLNGMLFFYQSDLSIDLLRGYSMYTWLVIITQAFVGITMGAIMKHSSNLVRLFVISCAMLITTVLSVVVFQLVLNLYFVLAFVFVGIALYIYHT